jgi:hypothetical protein
MMIAPAVMAAMLAVDFQGLNVITPWKSPAEGTARVWVFLPNTSGAGMRPHRATLRLAKGSVLGEDWNGSGTWNLDGYVLSVYREGVKEAPDQLRTWGAGAEESPWESLHWVLNLNRIVPNGRIATDPFAGKHAIAAIKLSDGDLDGAAPRHGYPNQVWVVEPAMPEYQQAFTDTIRYRIDLKGAATELRLEPVPGGDKPAKRIRLVTTADITATVTHLPPRGVSKMKTAHASAAAGLFADEASRDRIKAITVRPRPSRPPGALGGDPLCDSLIFNIRPVPPTPCIQCLIDLGPASIR